MSANTVDTYGWDSAFGITFKNANAAIKKFKSSPASFSANYHNSLNNQDYLFTGNFGDWQLSGGSGSLVHMSLPIISGTVTPQSGGNAQTYSGTATIEVKLAFLPQPTESTNGGETSNGQRNVLKVQTSSNNSETDPVAAVLNVQFDPESQFTDNVVLQSTLGDWLENHLTEFNHVFSAVDINERADKDQFQWLKPTYVNYAVYAPPQTPVDDYILGVLAMTENRLASHLSSEIAPLIVPQGANAGFLIGTERFVEKILMPYVYLLFQNASAADFDTRDDGLTVTNITSLNFQQFTLDDGKEINDAVIDAGKFEMDVFSTSVRISFTDMRFTWKQGFIVHLNYTGVSDLQADEKGHLQMTQIGTPSLAVTVTKTEGEEWTEILEEVGIGIGTALVSALIGGAIGAAADAAAEAGQAAADESLQAAAGQEIGMTTFKINGVAVDEIENLDELLAEEDELAANDVENAADNNYRTAFRGWFSRNWRKLLGTLVGTILGTTVGEIAVYLIESAHKDDDKLPTVDQFADESVSATTWPNATGYDLVSLKLNGALQMGLNIHFQD